MGALKDVVRPPIGSFTPSMWGHTFTSFSFDHQVEQKNVEAIEALKEEARSMLITAKPKKTAEKLMLIDTLERLGVGYRFDQEIEEQLQEIFKSYNYDDIKEKQEEDHDLFITSLQFRLLRQHRHYISSSIFDKFIGKDAKFNENLSDDAKGLLSLYEAAHLRVHGEPILDEAVSFTKHHLKRMLQQRQLESSPLEAQVKRALVHPLHRGSPLIQTHDYISFYEKDNSAADDLLLKFAKLNFNHVQNMYKTEICEVSRWWSELKSPFPYVRDRVVEAYLWGITCLFEPQYSYARKTVAKTIQILTILDDTYDTYATIEEADLFTQSLRRWNIDEIHQLPEYMKIIYQIVLSVYEDYERDAAEQGKLFVAPYAKEALIQVCEAYNKEIKWTTRQELPCFEEYIENAVIASCLFAITSTAFPGMKSITKETIDWFMSVPKIAVASARVCRYLDDVSGYDRESVEGKYLTGVDNYMKQHGLSIEETKDKFIELAEDEWKDLNKEWLSIKSVPKYMLEQVLGNARSSEIFYRSREDGYAKTEAMAPYVRALFIDPIII